MDPLPPDPYKALGVPKDADAALIKSTYRKLALKCHPDKVTDESLKAEKQEEFHSIQQAYELIGDEQKRGKYDAEVRLDQLRREKLARNAGAPNVDIKTGRYEVRTQAPSAATYTATTAHRYDEHKASSRPYDDRDRYQDERSARKYDTYEAYPKHGASRTPREKEAPPKASRATTDRTRSDRNRTRDKEDRRDRERKFVSVDSESSSDEKARYEAEYRRRSEDARRQREEDETRRQAAEKRRTADDQRRSYEDAKYDRQRKLNEMEDHAVRYINRSKVEAERPSPSRTNSSRDVRPDYYESRSSRRDPRPEAVRRSSARPTKERPATAGRERDRKGPQEIVEWEEDRKIPSFKHSTSSPAELHIPRATPQRSYTESSRGHRRTETSPTPSFRRSETMPSVPHNSSSRRKEATPVRPSTLRESVTPHDSGASSPEQYPTVPPPSSTKKYYYPTRGGGVSLSPEDMGVANGHRTVVHEPGSRRTRSPSPLSRPPMGANRPSESTVPKTSTMPPPLGRSATFNMNSGPGEDRGRDRSRLYGEINSDNAKRENARRQTSFSPDQVSYSSKYGPEDVRWSAARGRDSGRDEYAKPMLSRHATYAY